MSRSMDSMWTATGSPPSSASSPECAYPSLLRPLMDVILVFRSMIPAYLYLALSFSLMSLSPPSQWQPRLSFSSWDSCRLRSDLSDLDSSRNVVTWVKSFVNTCQPLPPSGSWGRQTRGGHRWLARRHPTAARTSASQVWRPEADSEVAESTGKLVSERVESTFSTMHIKSGHEHEDEA